MAITPDGSRVIVGDRHGNIEVCTADGKPLHALPRTQEVDWCTFAVSADGRTLVSTRPDGTILWWDLAAGKELATTKIPGPVPDQAYKSIQDMAFTPDGRRLVCSHQNAVLFAIDTETRKELWRIGPPTDHDSAAAVTLECLDRRPARRSRPAPRGPDRRLGVRTASRRRGHRAAGADR